MPAGAVILRHLERLVRVTDQIVYITTTMITTQKFRVKVRTHHHKVN